ncbi:hypothetical protein ACFQZZ_17100 [Nocardia sp. GCM10030253]|uniref:hypothetical protein n=1 Tax=Nocardia sp. GCM10030253 TaxID=3273404 RepID=UPI00363A86E5
MNGWFGEHEVTDAVCVGDLVRGCVGPVGGAGAGIIAVQQGSGDMGIVGQWIHDQGGGFGLVTTVSCDEFAVRDPLVGTAIYR